MKFTVLRKSSLRKSSLRKSSVLLASLFLVAACTSSGVSQEQSFEVSDSISVETETLEHVEGRETESSAQQSISVQENSGTVPVEGVFEVHFIDVGQGDATLLLHDKTAILIDAGRHDRAAVVPYLNSLGLTSLDLVLITHPHADHIGEFPEIMNLFNVQEVWWTSAVSTSNIFERSLAALEQSSALYREPLAGETFWFDQLFFEVVHPQENWNYSNLNEASLSVRVTFGEVTFLFTGDAEQAAEQAMLSSWSHLLSADILKLGHHGSRTSSSQAFVSAVNPQIGVYSAGANNSYGHPHLEVLDRMVQNNVTVYGTDLHGTVVVSSNGSSWDVTVSKNSSQVVVPSPSQSPSQSPQTSQEDFSQNSETCSSSQVDINSASIQDLESLIHVGSVRAQEIVELRPFVSLQDLTRVSGLGSSRVNDIVEQGVACVS